MNPPTQQLGLLQFRATDLAVTGSFGLGIVGVGVGWFAVGLTSKSVWALTEMHWPSLILSRLPEGGDRTRQADRSPIPEGGPQAKLKPRPGLTKSHKPKMS